jgi:phosphate transport system ATP-binding protein
MTISQGESDKSIFRIRNLDVYYSAFHALKNISVEFLSQSITALIGPSGCGKSTLLRCLNRMNDRIRGFRLEGEILLDGRDLYEKDNSLTSLRKRVGMVFQRPNPFPLTVFDNVAYGPTLHGMAKGDELQEIVEKSLQATDLWDSLKESLNVNALSLSPEQQQRLCISRLLAVEPDVLLMDEPCSALDPIATLKVEELLRELKEEYTIVIVTHNMQQASRISEWCGFMWLGELVEFRKTQDLFTRPQDTRTEEYVTGRVG